MIIINFTITISWIKYSYNPFRLKDEEIADMIECSLSVSFLLPSCEEIAPESLPAFNTISSPKSNTSASEPFISKGTVEHTSNCEFLLKIHHFLSFWKSLSSTKLSYTPTLSAIYALTISDRGQGGLNADVSENTLPFVSQSINNFSDYEYDCPLMFFW